MRRREFIAGTGLVAVSALAGCSSNAPPPRKSNVFENVRASDGTLEVVFEDDAWVKSRYDADGQEALDDPDDVGGLNPVGSASAKGDGGSGGRGATGRADGGYTDAPRTHHGRAWWHGGAYADDWYDEHSDEVSKYGVVVTGLGMAYLGDSEEMEDDAPNAGPVPWDCTISDPGKQEACTLPRRGWYRVGANLFGEQNNHDFKWECVDCFVDTDGSGYEVGREWKVSPRI